jgi:hypothetical protein
LNFWSKEKAMLKAISTIGNFGNVTLTSTDAGAGAGPLLDLYRNSASPAASDTIGEIEFNGQDSAGNKQQYALIHGSILSPTSTAETGQIHFETATGGASTEKMIIGTTNLVINDIGAVFNVRIEGDTDANLFFTDATNSRVGIGIITPAEKLDVVGNIKLSGNVIPASGFGIDFAATAGSGTSELLADYEEGTWTPSITFNVPGDLSVAYDSQVGRYTKIGNRVVLQGYVVTTTFTHTTASSYLKINGLPFAASSTAGIINVGPLMFRGITKAGYTDFVVSVEPTATSSLLIYCSASGTFTDFISAADMPSGGTVNFRFTITYQV